MCEFGLSSSSYFGLELFYLVVEFFFVFSLGVLFFVFVFYKCFDYYILYFCGNNNSVKNSLLYRFLTLIDEIDNGNSDVAFDRYRKFSVINSNLFLELKILLKIIIGIAFILSLNQLIFFPSLEFSYFLKFNFSIFCFRNCMLLVAFMSLYVIDNFFFYDKGSNFIFEFGVDNSFYFSRWFLVIYEFWSLYVILIISSLILISSNNWLLSYIVLELQNIILFIFISYSFSFSGFEAGVKYFFTSSLASVFFLIGVGLVSGVSGFLNFLDLRFFLVEAQSVLCLEEHWCIRYILVFGFFLILISFVFKLGLFPIYFWVLDVYQGSLSVVVFIFSLLSKFTYLFFFIRFYKELFNYVCYLFSDILIYLFIVLFCCFSILVGAVGVLVQNNFKRFLAYASMVHMGYVVLGFFVNSYESFVASLFYILVYGFLIYIMFWFLSIVRLGAYYDEVLLLEWLKDVILLSYRAGFCSISLIVLFIINLLSFASVPPLLGFWAKFFVFDSLINLDLMCLVFFLIFFNVVSIFYYVRLVGLLFSWDEFWFDFVSIVKSFNEKGDVNNSDVFIFELKDLGFSLCKFGIFCFVIMAVVLNIFSFVFLDFFVYWCSWILLFL